MRYSFCQQQLKNVCQQLEIPKEIKYYSRSIISTYKPLTEKDLLKKVNDVKFNQTSLIKMLEYFNSDPKILKKYNAFLEENKKT